MSLNDVSDGHAWEPAEVEPVDESTADALGFTNWLFVLTKFGMLFNVSSSSDVNDTGRKNLLFSSVLFHRKRAERPASRQKTLVSEQPTRKRETRWIKQHAQ